MANNATAKKVLHSATAVTTPRVRIDPSKLLKLSHPNLSYGAPKGSQNYRRGLLVKQAFLNALQKRGRGDMMKALEAVCDQLIKQACLGEVPSAKEMFDRIDGKAAQLIVGDEDNPIVFKNVTEMSDMELEQIARGHLISGESRRV